MASLKENIAQEKAVNTISGPLIIISCPGSGKTTTLVRRIHHMIEEGIEPSSILMVTFANAAARDMDERYRQMYGKNPGVTFATIHSLCFNILCMDGGYSKDSLMQEREKYEFFFWRFRNMPWVNDPWELTASMITELSAMKNSGIPLNEYEPSCCEKKYFDEMATRYEEEKDTAGKIDFDDMLIMCRDLLDRDRGVLAKWRRRFRYIQCDEYQDTNKIQRDILYAIAGDDANICVVGDDDQSIYRFRGADSSIMMHFADDYREKGAQTVMMSVNYRSAQKIVDIADACIGYNKVRFKKDFISQRGLEGEQGSACYNKFGTRADEMKYVLSMISREHAAGTPYKDMAILFRNNRLAQLPVQTLSQAGIPFDSTEKVKSIYDDWMFEDIQSYINLSMGNSVQRNLYRILNRPNRYLKTSAFAGVPFTTEGLMQAISYLRGSESWKYESARKAMYALINCFGPGKITAQTPPAELFKKLSGKGSVRYDKYIAQAAKFRKIDYNEMKEQFDFLKEDALKYATVGEWLDHAAIVSRMVREDNMKHDENGVRITTMHKSKGQEWKAVFLIDVNDGILPGRDYTSRDDMEEERRLLYVAMTRAKDRLYICGSSPAESPFMEETMKALDMRYNPPVKKKLAGSPVIHQKYGHGRVVSYTNDRVTIRFNDKDRKFKFPDAFREGYLEYV